MLSSTKLKQLIHHSTEIDTLDFKRELPDTLDKGKLAELVRDIIAIANAAYDSGETEGYLIFGVEDKTRTPCDIEGKILLLKKRGRKPKGTPPRQTEVDAHNQRILTKIVKDHVSGTGGRLITNYSSWEHPDDSNSLIGVLEIRAHYGPYTVNKEIPKLDQHSRTLGLHIQKGEAWIREGEDKRKMSPHEIISMEKEAKKRQRETRRIEKATKELGSVFQRWRMGFLETVDGEAPASKLIPQPLQTRLQIESCFCEPPKLAETLNDLGDTWYRNHLIISSPPSSGRTSLLSYLLALRSDTVARGRPIWIYQMPDSPDLDEFVAYIEKGLGHEIPRGTDRTIVLDLPLVQDNQLEFIQMLGNAFPRIRVWLTCDPQREDDLTRCLGSAFDRQPAVIRLPGYLDANPSFYSSLLESIFETPETAGRLLGENVVFRDIVTVYGLLSKGIEIVQEFQSTRLEQLAVVFSKLMADEQLVVRLISDLGGIRETVVHLILSALDTRLDAYERLVESSLVYVDESSPWREIRTVDDLPVQAGSLTVHDVRYLVETFKEADLGPLTYERWYLARKFAQLGELINDAPLQQRLDKLRYRLRGDSYCAHCDAHFSPSLLFCPNCGGAVGRKRGQVTSPGKAPVPFPDLELLKKGAFETSRGVSSSLARQLQETLPESRDSV